MKALPENGVPDTQRTAVKLQECQTPRTPEAPLGYVIM